MSNSADDSWKGMVTNQPEFFAGERDPEALPRAQSFTIELSGENVLLNARLHDGKTHTMELSPDMTLYLREYLTNALATIGYFDKR